MRASRFGARDGVFPATGLAYTRVLGTGMKRIFLSLSFVAAAAAALLAAGKGAKPKPTVPLVRSWSDAVKEAKLLNVPIVLHHHGFY